MTKNIILSWPDGIFHKFKNRRISIKNLVSLDIERPIELPFRFYRPIEWCLSVIHLKWPFCLVTWNDQNTSALIDENLLPNLLIDCIFEC